MNKFRLFGKLALVFVLLGYFMPIIDDEIIGVANMFELLSDYDNYFSGIARNTIGLCWLISFITLIILIVLSIYESKKSYILPSSTYLVFPFLSLFFFLAGTGLGTFVLDMVSIGGYFIIFGWLLAFIFFALSEASKKCPHCAELIKIDAKICPHCGKEFVEQETKKIELEALKENAQKQAEKLKQAYQVLTKKD